MRRSAFALLLALTAAPCLAQASDQAAALVRSFSSLCSGDTLDFRQLDAKAAAMKLQLHHEKNPDEDTPGHYKSWSLPRKENSEELSAIEANGAKGKVTSCGVMALDIDGEDFKQELTKALRLGDPRDETVSPDGSHRLSRWDYGAEGSGMQLMMVDGTPKGKPGINLSLIQADAARQVPAAQ